MKYAIYSVFSSKVKEKFKDVIGGAVEALTQNILNGPMKVPFAFSFSLPIVRSNSSYFFGNIFYKFTKIFSKTYAFAIKNMSVLLVNFKYFSIITRTVAL